MSHHHPDFAVQLITCLSSQPFAPCELVAEDAILLAGGVILLAGGVIMLARDGIMLAEDG